MMVAGQTVARGDRQRLARDAAQRRLDHLVVAEEILGHTRRLAGTGVGGQGE